MNDQHAGTDDLKRSTDARVDRLAALTDIRSLFVTYGQHLDSKDWDAYIQVFTEDIEFVAQIGVVKGRSAIRELFDRTLKEVPQAFHVFSEPTIDVDGDAARTESMWMYVRTGRAGAPEVLQFGRYRDTLVRSDGRWFISRREITRAAGSAPYER